MGHDDAPRVSNTRGCVIVERLLDTIVDKGRA